MAEKVPHDAGLIMIPGFSPETEVLLLRANRATSTIDPERLRLNVSQFYLDRQDILVVRVTVHAGDLVVDRFVLGFRGLTHVPPAAFALAHDPVPDHAIRPGSQRIVTGATLSGDDAYPQTEAINIHNGLSDPQPNAEQRFEFNHDWEADGPPRERFFDLARRENQLSVTLAPVSGGPIYAIRYNEERKGGGGRDRFASIILVQVEAGIERIDAVALSGWLTRRFATPAMRAIAWVYLGNEWRPDDPEAPATGLINNSPKLAITGQIAGSFEINA